MNTPTIITEAQMRDRLREACAAAGGQAAFAREIGVTRQFIGQILAGEKSPTKAIRNRLGLTGTPQRVYVVLPISEGITP